ncbi:MAG: hypothetical protein RL715_474 [Chloroflexota bacterium]
MSAGRPLAIHAQGVRVARGEREVLCGLDLSLAEGESLAIIGANGSGKSTLLSLIAGLLPHDAGALRIFDAPPHAGRSDVAIAFQDARLMTWRSALRNVTLPLEVGEGRRSAVSASVRSEGEAALARVGAAEVADRSPLDEPFSALDALTRDRLNEELPEMVGSASVLLVTHDMEEALLVADRVVVLGSAGAIVAETPGLRGLPAAQRRAALSAGAGIASQQALREALRA